MIIDIHNHADYHGCNCEAMLRNMDENGIDITCLLSWEAPAHEVDPGTRHAFSPFSDGPVPFERCVAYKEKVPERFLLGFCPDPRRPGAVARMKAALGLYDLSMCGELKLRMMLDNPDAVRLYRFCGENGLPVLVHLDYEISNWWYGGGIDALERALALCPETSFIGHAPGFWAHISGDELHKTQVYPKGPVVPGGRIEQLLAKYPNLCCDISAGSGLGALSRDHDFTRAFLLNWQDRVLFGRDDYDGAHRALLESLDLPGEVLAKIYEGNARRVLRGGECIAKGNARKWIGIELAGETGRGTMGTEKNSERSGPMRVTSHPILGDDTDLESIHITIDGQGCTAKKGEVIAAAMLANGFKTHRYTTKRHEPRGIYCGIGQCTDCVMTVDGVPNVRTCITQVAEGMVIETQDGFGGKKVDAR